MQSLKTTKKHVKNKCLFSGRTLKSSSKITRKNIVSREKFAVVLSHAQRGYGSDKNCFS